MLRLPTFLLRATLASAVIFTVDARNGSSYAADRPEVTTHRARLEMTERPEHAANVLAVLQQLKAQSRRGETPQLDVVVVVGKVGGMPNPWTNTHPDFPWFSGQASFFLLDSKVAVQFAQHAKSHGGNHQCAFCKSLAAKNAHAVAVINLVDEQGGILKIDTRELLDLRESQTVAVRGRAELLAGTMLVLHAEGIYVRSGLKD